MLVDQQTQEHPLGEVGVVVLVHEHVLEAARDALAHVRALVEQLERAQDEVAEVERAALGQQAVVVGVEAGELELARRAGARGVGLRRRHRPLGVGAVVLGRDHLVLQPVDARDEAGEQRRRVAADLVLAKREVVDALEQEREAVGGRDRREEGIHAGLERLVLEQAQAERAERLHVQLLVGSLERHLQALAHLGGGGCREGEREDPLRGHSLAHEPHEAAHHGLGLSGAGPGRDDERAVGMGDGRLLRAVQAVEGYRHRGLGYAAACPFRTAPIGLPSAAARPAPPATPFTPTPPRLSEGSKPAAARAATWRT